MLAGACRVLKQINCSGAILWDNMGGLVVVATLLAVFCINANQSAVLDGTLQQQLRLYNTKIKMLDSLLSRECPSQALAKRETATDDLQFDLKMTKLHYELLRRQVIECQKLKKLTTPEKSSTSWGMPINTRVEKLEELQLNVSLVYESSNVIDIYVC